MGEQSDERESLVPRQRQRRGAARRNSSSRSSGDGCTANAGGGSAVEREEDTHLCDSNRLVGWRVQQRATTSSPARSSDQTGDSGGAEMQREIFEFEI